MTAPAQAFYTLVKPLAADQRKRNGPGLFYASFQTRQQADAFAATPLIAANMFYFDQEKCRALWMPDTVLGAVTAGRTDIIIVLDVFSDGQRYYSDSNGTIHAEPCKFGFVKVTPPPSADDLLSNAVSEWAEDKVRGSVAASQQPLKAGVIFHMQLAENYDIHQPFTLEIVEPEDARLEIAKLEAAMDGEIVSASMQTLLELSGSCQPGEGVIWLRSEGETRGDIAWKVCWPVN